MDLLIAQCVDLESLLALARREAVAAEQSDFSELVNVARDRATLGERLESYHRQIAELRASMSAASEPLSADAVTKETIRLAVEIQALDARTRTMLLTTRGTARSAIDGLEQGRRSFAAYLHGDTRTSGCNCDWQA